MTKKYIIESNIAVPPAGRRTKHIDSKYPFQEMKDGQSFHVPCKKNEVEKYRLRFCVAARSMGIKVITRKTRNKNQVGLRVWRMGKARKTTK